MRPLDVTVLFVCALALFFELQHTSTFRFDYITHLNIKGPSMQPIITDLDGDGRQDILATSVGGPDKLVFLSWVGSSLQERHRISVRTVQGVLPSAHILKVATGVLDLSSPTSQFVVVVTNHLDIMVFDKQLNVLWLSSIPDPAREAHFVDGYEIAIVATDTPIWQGDRGAVIVGIRAHQEDAIESNKWRHEADFIADLKSQEGNAKDELKELQTTNHFNYYAFEGLSGELRWKHQYLRENDWEERDPEGNTIMSTHSWKLHVASQRHFERHDWEVFHDSFLSILPHQWYLQDDTRFELAHFKQQHKIAKSMNKTWQSEAIGVPKKTLPKFLQGAAPERVLNYLAPNVIVAHTSLGIEVIHLYSGRPVTQLHIRNHAYYADFNDDHTIDQIWTRVGRDASAHHQRGMEPAKGHFAACSAIFGSGVPNARQILANVSLCYQGGWFTTVKKSEDDVKDAANPIVISNHNSFLNDVTLSPKQAVFFTNDGTLSAFNRYYTLLWQIDTEIPWDPSDHVYQGMFPTLTPFKESPHTDNKDDEMILVLSTKLLLVSGTGSIMAKADLPYGISPSGYPLIADINGDGLNDIVVRSKVGYTVYLLHGSGSVFFPIVLGIFLVTFLALLFTIGLNYQPQTDQGKDKQEI